MASVASSGQSPISGYDPLLAESTGDDESWAFIDPSGDSNPSSIGFFPSPASGSMASYGIVGHQGQVQPSPPAPSPLYLDTEHAGTFSVPFPDQSSALDMSSAVTDSTNAFLTSADAHSQGELQGEFMLPGDFSFDDHIQDVDLTPFLDSFPSTAGALDQQFQPAQLEIPPQLQSHPNVQPWGPTNLKQDDGVFVMEGFRPSPSPTQFSASVSPPSSAGPRSPNIKQEQGSSSHRVTMPSPIRKVRGAGSRVEKKRSAASSELSSSAGSASKFVIVTPQSINEHSGRHNPFECFEAMRTTQKGRKGPLANEIKENALQVRRVGACFCCHARKVKCDTERPCKNCKKLAAQVPQVVCWQFQDFLTVLFPEFIRGHFKKEEMTKFVTENIEGFTVGGAEKPCSVELFSGARFATTLTIRAKFFTAKTQEVLQHVHMNVGGNGMNLLTRGSAPIGLEMEGGSRRDELRKKSREYINSIIQEPAYAEQLTDSLLHTELPQKILRIVQRYCKRSESTIVKKALSIYTMHYVMTRHLCLTRQSVLDLQQTELVPQDVPWVTPRVLNRQIKSVLDEMLMREMQLLFEAFSKSLKPKSRKEWAPCTAAFLVLCLFMESVETAADTFVISQNEADLRSRQAPRYKRDFALKLNLELENLPFKQFAYQFHQIYQTHSKDAATKPFNPLLDESIGDMGELDSAGIEMVRSLKALVQGDSWAELDFLTIDPILPNKEQHPYPRDVSFNYTGRLSAKFLLSFLDETHIFGLDA